MPPGDDPGPVLPERLGDVLHGHRTGGDRRLGAAQPVGAHHRYASDHAQPADVIADPVAIAVAEQWRVGVAAGGQRGDARAQDLGDLEVAIALLGLGAFDPQHARAVVDVAHDPVGDLARAEPHEERDRGGEPALVALAERGLDEAARLVDPELGLAAGTRPRDLEPRERIARQPAPMDAPGRERPGRGELADLRVDDDLSAPALQQLAREPGRQRAQRTIATDDTEQAVEPVPAGGHRARPPALRSEAVEVGVDGAG